MENVGNDEEGVRRQALDQVTQRSANLLGSWAQPEGESLGLCHKFSCLPPDRVWLTSHTFQLPDLASKLVQRLDKGKQQPLNKWNVRRKYGNTAKGDLAARYASKRFSGPPPRRRLGNIVQHSPSNGHKPPIKSSEVQSYSIDKT